MSYTYEPRYPTEKDAVLLGLKKPPEEPKTVMITYPKRYTSSAVVWVTEWVTEKTYEWMQNMRSVQFIRRKGKQ